MAPGTLRAPAGSRTREGRKAVPGKSGCSPTARSDEKPLDLRNDAGTMLAWPLASLKDPIRGHITPHGFALFFFSAPAQTQSDIKMITYNCVNQLAGCNKVRSGGTACTICVVCDCSFLRLGCLLNAHQNRGVTSSVSTRNHSSGVIESSGAVYLHNLSTNTKADAVGIKMQYGVAGKTRKVCN